ncbi:MAG TPA: radical SAM protein [Candidatus Nanoarchaeia archaeon]|nr:radical SAM protein [Candidatus Nanoarchaeia archaeon]
MNLTEKCNLRCTHCYGFFGNKKEDELTLEDFNRVIKELASLNVFYANICGGEPTQSPYFKEIIQGLNKKKVHYMLSTNGVMSNELLNYINNNGELLIGVKISLDGYDAESHGVIRKGPTLFNKEAIFNQTINSIKFFSDRGYPITIATSLHKDTLDNLEKMEELIINLNPAAWYLSPITENGRANENSYLFENITQYENKIRKISKNVEERGIVVKVVDIVLDKNELNNFSFDCGASLAHCEIHADGTVSPCTLSRITMHNKYLSFPNIKNQTLKQIWDSEQFNKFRSYQTMGCSGCRSFKNCNRCVAQIFQYYGEPTQAPLLCNSISDKLGVKKNTLPIISQRKNEINKAC